MVFAAAAAYAFASPVAFPQMAAVAAVGQCAVSVSSVMGGVKQIEHIAE